MTSPRRPGMASDVHGLLLTGGASARMGRDKARIPVGEASLAARAARALAAVARPVLAVGPESGTGLEPVDDPREGPLVALVCGADALAERGHAGPVLLVACDMPLVTAALLGLVAGALGNADAAVPLAGGRDQPLAACYAPSALGAARRLVAGGTRAMRDLLDTIGVRRIPEAEWRQVASPEALLDCDTPEDLEAARRILDAPA